MNELDALDLAALAAEALGEARCRRYLFDRPSGQDLHSQDLPAETDGAAGPLPAGWGEGAERRG